jgi:hypothetical protein
VRQTWRLLLLAGVGILAAVVLVCTVPLYSAVSLTAGLRGVLNATPQSSEIGLQFSTLFLSSDIVARADQEVNRVMQQQLGVYLQKKTNFFIKTQQLPLDAPASIYGDSMGLTGASMQDAAQHVRILRGRLPLPLSDTLEIAISEPTAKYLKMDVGSTLTLSQFFFGPVNPSQVEIPMHIVGIMAVISNDPFWHGQNFEPPEPGPGGPPPTNFSALMSNDSYLAALHQAAVELKSPTTPPFEAGETVALIWYYHLNPAQIDISQLDDLVSRLQAAQRQIGSGNISSSSIFRDPQIFGLALPDAHGSSTLERFQARISVVNVPVTILLFQVVGLILFFVGMMAGLLIERQAEVIALLRSRGAKRRQVFGSFAFQSVGLALIAFIAGPLLAILAARALVQQTLSPTDQQALNIISGDPLPVALRVGWFALAAAFAAVLAMLFAIRGSASRDVLEMRRESARATRRPLWQRVYLDMAAVIVALTGFAFSLYITHSGVLDAESSLVISAPLALVAPIFLVIAGILLFLRFFPTLLRLFSRIASRRAGAAPMLAMAQMARAPRQAVRMILLLALASSFASFALVFIASESSHIQKIAAYETGADFSGPVLSQNFSDPVGKQAIPYRKIPGVLSATLGYAGDASLEQTSQTFPIRVRAVDASTFAQTAIWTDEDSSQSLSSLMNQLVAKRRPTTLVQADPVPAIVDALAWKTLNLSVGAPFVLNIANTNVVFEAIAEVEHIPTINDSLVSGPSSDFTVPGGILTDYQTMAPALQSDSGTGITPNYLWLRTSDDPALLAKVRKALSQGPLALQSINDRRAMIAGLEKDPLYIALINVLALGTATTVLLALVGNLIASWLSARARLINFALLRALGSAPRQIARVLTWEQTIVYSTAIALGAFFGALLAATIVPALIFTGLPDYTSDTSSGEFFAIQHVLSTQMVIPLSLVIIFVALVVICAVAIGMMARVASRPSISQTLRLNDD